MLNEKTRFYAKFSVNWLSDIIHDVTPSSESTTDIHYTTHTHQVKVGTQTNVKTQLLLHKITLFLSVKETIHLLSCTPDGGTQVEPLLHTKSLHL